MIGLHEPFFGGNELKYLEDCIESGWVSSAGEYVRKFEHGISEYTGAAHAIACVNGSSALQVTIRALGIHGGDEVLVPSITFIATINAIRANNATPVFMDVDELLNLDIEKTKKFLAHETETRSGECVNKRSGRRVAGVIPVHVFGNAARVTELLDICKEKKLAIIEDAAESLGTRYKDDQQVGAHTGTIGIAGCLSFNGNKIITAGGGGMVITDDYDLAQRIRYLTTQAVDDPARYKHGEAGYNFRLTNLQAAVGLAQLEQLPAFLERKEEIFQAYRTGLADNANVELVEPPHYANVNHWINVARFSWKKAERKSKMTIVIDALSNLGVQARRVWYPNHLQRPYAQCQTYMIENAAKCDDRYLCLPSGYNVDSRIISQICERLA
jgi:perosamine synthetase